VTLFNGESEAGKRRRTDGPSKSFETGVASEESNEQPGQHPGPYLSQGEALANGGVGQKSSTGIYF
jgi:hypothetical protein